MMNNRCHINAVFGDVICPLFACRGKLLSKDKLSEGVETDDNLHIKVASEYNSHSCRKCNNDTFPKLKKAISHIIQYRLTDYDTYFKKWKLSRNHD